MSVLDFLKTTKKTVASQIEEMQASLVKLRAERKDVEAVVEEHAPKRAAMLLSDASDAEIAQLDAAANLAQIRLERLEIAELQLQDRLERARNKSERERLATEHERAAAAIEEKAKALEGPMNALAAAFDELVKVIPAETFTEKYSDGHLMPQPARPEDVARAIVASGIYNNEPRLFELLRAVRANTLQQQHTHFEKAMSLYSWDGGRLAPFGGQGEPKVFTAPIAADLLIVGPLREKAAALRTGDAELLQAAE
ncbi:hypothetical protein [Methylocystis sp.]|uniref:hypothetical protein n=1 Tax=Methylocystis sp. TaxID=1911079 RepID=UPI0025D8C1E7|nr:hypothetical protein [Methylocystis sp.]